MEQKGANLRQSLNIIHQTISVVLGLQKGRKSDLSPIAISILYNSNAKKLKVTDISLQFDIKKSTASGYVDNLEEKGYVNRVKDAKNRRNTYIVPTDKGKKWILSKEKVLSDYIKKHMAKLTASEQKEFVDLLNKFVKEN
jgi:DNA-binding MarR family transcriptional regulator